MAIIRIGATAATLAAVPDPKELKVSLQDIDSSGAGRSANGTMIRDRVAGGATAKRKIELKWPACDSATASQILTAIKDTFFFVEYPDPYTGALRTAEFYAGDRSVPVYSVWDGLPRWESISVNIIEK